MNCANHPDREHVAFCQNCGKATCQECARPVGSAVFCEPCLAARLADIPGTSGTSYVSPASGTEGAMPPPIPGAPNPLIATILGFIPGVGAMYNGQYAKGVVHLIVFAILISLTSNASGLFGLFIAGWIIYQALDANHTARARLAGTPLPNPFGLNDIGERLGFGKSWPTAPPGTVPGPVSGPVGSAVPPNAQQPPPPYPPPASNWGAPPEGYNYVVPPVPPVPPYTPYSTNDPSAYVPPAPNRIPTGALWLIGLGVFFLVGNSGIFRHFTFRLFTPLLMIGLGIWLFIRKMTGYGYGYGLTDDGTLLYRLRLISSLRGSIWLVLIGVIFFLADYNILSWSRSWPLFIIVAGLMALLERSIYNVTPFTSPAPQPVPPTPPSPSTSLVPIHPHDTELHDHDQEGS